MAQNQQNSSESLAKSHSKWSNTKLTTVCIIATISSTMVWVSLAFLETQKTLGWIGVAVFGVLTALNILLLNKFKR